MSGLRARAGCGRAKGADLRASAGLATVSASTSVLSIGTGDRERAAALVAYNYSSLFNIMMNSLINLELKLGECLPLI